MRMLLVMGIVIMQHDIPCTRHVSQLVNKLFDHSPGNSA